MVFDCLQAVSARQRTAVHVKIFFIARLENKLSSILSCKVNDIISDIKRFGLKISSVLILFNVLVSR